MVITLLVSLARTHSRNQLPIPVFQTWIAILRESSEWSADHASFSLIASTTTSNVFHTSIADTNQFLPVDFFNVGPAKVVKVDIRGRLDLDQWVTKFRLTHSIDGVNYSDVDGGFVFDGNVDRSSIVTVSIVQKLRTNFIKIIPVKWNNWIVFKTEMWVIPSRDD